MGRIDEQSSGVFPTSTHFCSLWRQIIWHLFVWLPWDSGNSCSINTGSSQGWKGIPREGSSSLVPPQPNFRTNPRTSSASVQQLCTFLSGCNGAVNNWKQSSAHPGRAAFWIHWVYFGVWEGGWSTEHQIRAVSCYLHHKDNVSCARKIRIWVLLSSPSIKRKLCTQRKHQTSMKGGL